MQELSSILNADANWFHSYVARLQWKELRSYYSQLIAVSASDTQCVAEWRVFRCVLAMRAMRAHSVHNAQVIETLSDWLCLHVSANNNNDDDVLCVQRVAGNELLLRAAMKELAMLARRYQVEVNDARRLIWAARMHELVARQWCAWAMQGRKRLASKQRAECDNLIRFYSGKVKQLNSVAATGLKSRFVDAFNAGAQHMQAKRNNEAIECFRRACAAAGSAPSGGSVAEAWRCLSVCAMRADDLVQALDAACRGLLANPVGDRQRFEQLVRLVLARGADVAGKALDSVAARLNSTGERRVLVLMAKAVATDDEEALAAVIEATDPLGDGKSRCCGPWALEARAQAFARLALRLCNDAIASAPSVDWRDQVAQQHDVWQGIVCALDVFESLGVPASSSSSAPPPLSAESRQLLDFIDAWCTLQSIDDGSARARALLLDSSCDDDGDEKHNASIDALIGEGQFDRASELVEARLVEVEARAVDVGQVMQRAALLTQQAFVAFRCVECALSLLASQDAVAAHRAYVKALANGLQQSSIEHALGDVVRTDPSMWRNAAQFLDALLGATDAFEAIGARQLAAHYCTHGKRLAQRMSALVRCCAFEARRRRMSTLAGRDDEHAGNDGNELLDWRALVERDWWSPAARIDVLLIAGDARRSDNGDATAHYAGAVALAERHVAAVPLWMQQRAARKLASQHGVVKRLVALASEPSALLVDRVAALLRLASLHTSASARFDGLLDAYRLLNCSGSTTDSIGGVPRLAASVCKLLAALALDSGARVKRLGRVSAKRRRLFASHMLNESLGIAWQHMTHAATLFKQRRSKTQMDDDVDLCAAMSSLSLAAAGDECNVGGCIAAHERLLERVPDGCVALALVCADEADVSVGVTVLAVQRGTCAVALDCDGSALREALDALDALMVRNKQSGRVDDIDDPNDPAFVRRWQRERADIDADLNRLATRMEAALGSDALALVRSAAAAAAADDRFVVLLVDKLLHRLPWECVPALRECAVSRMPTLSALCDLAARRPRAQAASPSPAYFVLDPTNEFEGTQTRFAKRLESLEQCTGCVATRPSADVWSEKLAASNLFLYFGHRGGEQFVSLQKIERTTSSAIVFLMGCSSAALPVEGEYGPHGIALSYLSAGCLAVVGNLWAVTDVDIDGYAERLLDAWAFAAADNASSPVPLARAVVDARAQCRFKRLTGFAPILFGLPYLSIDDKRLAAAAASSSSEQPKSRRSERLRAK
jgi:Peptidase family C50